MLFILSGGFIKSFFCTCKFQFIPTEQLQAFLQEAKATGVYEMYYIELATGLRRGELLGHFSAGFTLDTYAHVTTSAQKEAAQTMGNILAG